MKDRHLCKAKRTDTGEWVEGFYVRCRNHDYILPIFNDCEVSYGYDDRYDDFVEVDPSTICQCTGLKDKNGKLIWENDIVKRKFRLYSGETKYEEKESSGIVKYEKKYARFGYQCSVFTMLTESRKHDTLKVIGNIFDNPKLLEAGKEAEEKGNQDLLMPAT